MMIRADFAAKKNIFQSKNKVNNVSSPFSQASRPQMKAVPFAYSPGINFEGRLPNSIKKEVSTKFESIVTPQRYGANISLSHVASYLNGNSKVKTGTINFVPKIDNKNVEGFDSLSIYFEKNKKSTKLIAFNPKTPDQIVKVRIKHDINPHTDVRLFMQKGKLTAGIDDGQHLMIAQDGNIRAKKGAVMLNMGKKNYPLLNIKIPTTKGSGKLEKPLSQYQRTYKGKPLIIGVKEGVADKEHIAKIIDFLNSKNVTLKTPEKFFNSKQQPMILSGGMGSRFVPGAELSKKGATTLKSLVDTPTGDSPIIDMMKNLHESGVFDLRGAKVGKDIKFVIEDKKPGDNFNSTLSATKALEKPKDGYLFFPNDAICNMPKGVQKMVEKHNENKALVTLLMKEMPAEQCVGKYGIVAMNGDNVTGFVEKPKSLESIGMKKGDKVTTNLFQFMVSDEAMKVNDTLLRNGLKTKDGKKIAWSEDLFFPLATIANHNHPAEMKKACPSLENVPDKVLQNCKKIVGDKKVKAVSTAEPWADTGDMKDLRDVSVKIATGQLKISRETNAHVAKATDPKGLIAQNETQKNKVLSDYEVEGDVMSFHSGPAYSEEALNQAEQLHKDAMKSHGFDYDNHLN